MLQLSTAGTISTMRCGTLCAHSIVYKGIKRPTNITSLVAEWSSESTFNQEVRSSNLSTSARR